MEALPAELLSFIFVLAADEDILFQHGLPTSMASSAWCKGLFGVWTLRPPNEALNVLQRRSYTTKKSIMMTCRAFHRVASELMFHCLFFNTPDKLPLLCAELDKKTTDPSPAWWSRRVHLTYYNVRSTIDQDSGTALCSILRHCSNLEIAVLSVPTTVDSFMFLADTLCTYNKHTLHTLHLSVPISSLSKLIWMLASLPNLTCLHVSLTSIKDQTTDEEEAPELGAAQDIMFTLEHLTQLSLYGHTAPFLEQACNWNFPSLRFLSIHTFHDDIIPFLDVHGKDLTFLDVNCQYRIHVDQAILRCPQLTTLCFNADWNIEGELAHERVHSVGLHGLKFAFSPPTSESTHVFPLDSMTRRYNDTNFASVMTSGHFPKLERVRVLSGPVLSELEKRGGPGGAPPGPYGYIDESEDGMKRWERWWDTCHRAGVRLEDCTGGELGILPGTEQEIDDEDDEESDEEVEESEDSGEEEEDGDEDEWEEYSWEYEVPPIDNDTSGVGELRKLIEECREMERSRQQ